MTATQLKLLSCAVILLVAAGVITWLRTRPDDGEFTRIAYPCLPLDVVTTDPAKCVMVTGYRAPPLEHTMPDGSVVYAVFYHRDPKVVPLVDGKVLFFPARFVGEDDLETPPLPPRNRPLDKMYRSSLVRFMSDEASQQLKTAVTGHAPATGATP